MISLRTIAVVFVKEVLENLRDRRVIFSAFFFGVLLAPAIFALTTTMASKRVVQDQDRPLQLPVVGEQHAPNLLRFLRENGVETQRESLSALQAIDAVRDGKRDFVLIIPESYDTKLREGEPAP